MMIGSRTRTVAICSLVIIGLGCTQEPQPSFPQNAEEGAILYAKYCALCHAPSGEGYKADSATALNNEAFLATASDSFLYNAISEGRPGTTMSAWADYRGGPLSEADIWNMVGLLRSWQTISPIDVSKAHIDGVALRGEPVYTVYCSSCHGPNGAGDSYVSLNNPQFLADASNGFIRFAIINGRPGTPMEPYQAVLSTQDIDDVVSLIRSWQKPTDPGPLLLPSSDLGEPVLHPEGDEPAFIAEEIYVSLDDLTDAMQSEQRLVLLDARLPADYVKSHMSGAVSVPFYDVESYVDQLDPDTWIVAYCGCPHAESMAAARVLNDNGFSKVVVLDEGFDAWIEAGLPTKTGPLP